MSRQVRIWFTSQENTFNLDRDASFGFFCGRRDVYAGAGEEWFGRTQIGTHAGIANQNCLRSHIDWANRS